MSDIYVGGVERGGRDEASGDFEHLLERQRGQLSARSVPSFFWGRRPVQGSLSYRSLQYSTGGLCAPPASCRAPRTCQASPPSADSMEAGPNWTALRFGKILWSTCTTPLQTFPSTLHCTVDLPPPSDFSIPKRIPSQKNKDTSSRRHGFRRLPVRCWSDW